MKESENPPRWNDPNLKAGTRIRTALWLLSEVGAGNTFTKEQHRAAFPGVAQADRRLRDLRDWGWVIHTSAQDAALNQDEQRFVAAGAPVWERGVEKTIEEVTLTSKQRMAVLAENDYQCALCGISGGECYPDAPHMTAVLGVSRRSVTDLEGQSETLFLPECKRCRSGKAEDSCDIPLFLDKISRLGPSDQAMFAQWVKDGRQGALDQFWSEFRRMPSRVRDQIRKRLK